MSVRTMVLIVALSTSVALSACQSEEDFGTCPMTDKMLTDCNNAIPVEGDQCTGDEAFCAATCIVSDHPYCGYGPCVLYRFRDVADTNTWKSDPFCGRACDTTMDCPALSTCRAMYALKKPCENDADCTGTAPWASCESDGFCTWHVCIPDQYGAGVGQ